MTPGIGVDQHRHQALKWAYTASGLAILGGGLFSLMDSDSSVSMNPATWVYENASAVAIFLTAWGVAWNILYLAAARRVVAAMLN
jgi:hypothetical protein